MLAPLTWTREGRVSSSVSLSAKPLPSVSWLLELALAPPVAAAEPGAGLVVPFFILLLPPMLLCL